MTKKAQKAANGKPDPARQTVGDLLKTSGVPLHVQVWLDRFARGDEYALEKYGCGDDPGVNDIAFLVYDVLEAQHGSESVVESSEEARDFVEEWLYTLSNYYDQHVWNNAEAALAVFPYLFTGGGSPMEPEGDAAYVLLRTAIERLTTKPERRAFLRDTTEDDAEPEKESTTNRAAAFKLARVLADPRTTNETWWHLRDVLTDFSAALELDITHPALVRRAFQIMCEARPKGKVRELRALRRRVLDALDALPELADEKGGAR